VEINSGLPDNPATINESPYDQGWMIKIKAADTAPLGELMSGEEYSTYRS
jgi:glycine cleavage system H protein